MDLIQHIDEYFDRPFIITPDANTLTYGELLECALNVIGNFQQRGIGKGDRIGLLTQNGKDMVILYWACLLGGYTAVPINILFSQRDINHIISVAGLDLIISDGPVVPTESDRFFRLDLDRTIFSSADHKLESLNEDRLWTIFFTSGTTGRPKAVPHSVRSLFLAAYAFNSRLSVDTESRFYHVLPMGYMAGFLNTLVCPFLAGGSVVLGRPFDAQSILHFWNEPKNNDVNSLWIVPSMMAMLNAMDRDPRARNYCETHLKTVCCGTAPLPLAVKEHFEEKYGIRVHESYGLSETLFLCSNGPGTPNKKASVGTPINGAKLTVKNSSGASLAAGQTGEIFASVPWLMETGDSSEPIANPFPSGDLGYLDADGYLFITGRKKDIIIKGGRNISPRVIEELFLEHASVYEVSVVGVEHPILGEDVVAYVVPVEGVDQTDLRRELLAQAKMNLAPHEVPSQYEFVRSLPRNSSGKILKRKIKKGYLA